MLLNVLVEHFAILTHADIDFQSGMIALTGETGSGKSVVIDALMLALGERVSGTVVQPGAEHCQIVVTFDARSNPSAIEWCQAQAFDVEDVCMFRCTIYKDGRTKRYINGVTATAQQQRALASFFVTAHSQHAQQTLLKSETQRRLLDRFSGHESLCKAVQLAYEAWKKITTDLHDYASHVTKHAAEQALLLYQIQELDELGLIQNEWETLSQEHRLYASQEQWLSAAEKAFSAFDIAGEANLLGELTKIRAQLSKAAEINPHLREIATLCVEAAVSLEEAGRTLNQRIAQASYDPKQLEKMEERLSLIHTIARKHRVAPEFLYDHYLSLKTKLVQLDEAEIQLTLLREQQQASLNHYGHVETQLDQARQIMAKEFEEAITERMQVLGMEGGVFSIIADHLDQEPRSEGNTHIEFWVITNPGMPRARLSEIASGGECSRIALAIYVLTASRQESPTLIFDEIDVGIGGATASIVGRLLRTLGKTAQVISITHLPQIAASADQQVRVIKRITNGITQAEVETVEAVARIDELARMLGGTTITAETRAQASTLLKQQSKTLR